MFSEQNENYVLDKESGYYYDLDSQVLNHRELNLVFTVEELHRKPHHLFREHRLLVYIIQAGNFPLRLDACMPSKRERFSANYIVSRPGFQGKLQDF